MYAIHNRLILSITYINMRWSKLNLSFSHTFHNTCPTHLNTHSTHSFHFSYSFFSTPSCTSKVESKPKLHLNHTHIFARIIASSMSSLTADLIHPISTAVDNGRDNTSSSNSNASVRFSKRQQQQSPIQPPTTPLTASSSFTTQHSNSSSTTTTTPIHEYSLFDQHPAAWEWFGNNENNNVWRKHSVAADGADFGTCQQQRRGSAAYQNGTTAADWRRGSATAASGLCCALCSSPQAGSQLCGHTICHVCLSSLGTSSCPLCCTQVLFNHIFLDS